MNRSIVIAGVMALSATVWVLSGNSYSDSEDVSTPEKVIAKESAPKQLSKVKARLIKAEKVLQEVVINGRTAPGRKVTLLAQTRGKVHYISKKRGAEVKAGEAILHFAMDDRQQQLDQASALLEQRKIEYRASQSLKDKGLRAESQMAEATTQLKAAEAALKAIELDIEKTVVKAPFDGVLDSRIVEQGSFLSIGDPIATVVDINPYLIIGDLAEREVVNIQQGQKVVATTADHRNIEGTVSYISTEADDKSRTFHIEVTIPNPEGERMLGITTEMRIPVKEVLAHKLSPSLLSLNDGGVLGVKAANEEGIVEFYPVEIARSDSDGIWLTGIPEQIRLITVGQGFVRDGDHVDVVMEQ